VRRWKLRSEEDFGPHSRTGFARTIVYQGAPRGVFIADSWHPVGPVAGPCFEAFMSFSRDIIGGQFIPSTRGAVAHRAVRVSYMQHNPTR
jgi:hypothetical protein